MSANLLWYHQPLGNALLRAEEVQLQNLLPQFPGKHCLCLNPLMDTEPCTHSPMPNRFYYRTYTQHTSLTKEQRQQIHVFGEEIELPFLADSVDLIVAPHALDFCSNPHAWVDEIWRILAPNGRIVVTGFNTNSLFGLPTGIHHDPKQALLPSGRGRKLLLAQGFTLELSKTFYFRPLFRKSKRLQQFGFFEIIGDIFWPAMGCLYLFVAQKPVLGMTPLKAKKVKPGLLAPKGVVEPTV